MGISNASGETVNVKNLSDKELFDLINNTKDVVLLGKLEQEYIDRSVQPEDSDLSAGDYIIIENNDY
jgi:hypothetical protein